MAGSVGCFITLTLASLCLYTETGVVSLHLTPLALQLALTQKPRLILGCESKLAIAVRDTLVYS